MIWEAFLREMEWLYAQMNRELRRMFAPLIALFEMKTIVLCLRNRAIGRTAEVERLLRRSLLSNAVKDDLRLGIPPVPYDQNLQTFENNLMRIYLEDVAGRRLHPVLRTFFAHFIDLRNLMLLYKRRRWKVAAQSPFIAGGSIDPARLDESGLSDASLETVLLSDMTRELARMRHDHDVGLIVLYIWRIYVQARNLAILHHGAGLDPETLERELIL